MSKNRLTVTVPPRKFNRFATGKMRDMISWQTIVMTTQGQSYPTFAQTEEDILLGQ